MCGRFHLSLDRPLVMGILNITPDSFSDAGRLNTLGAICECAETMLRQGVDILDIGGESTRPNAATVSIGEELDRVLPALEVLASYDVPLSLDTRKTEVMRQALATHHVDMINDICALEDAGALEAVTHSQAAVCLMHMQGTPQTMQIAPTYRDVVTEVTDYLQHRCEIALQQGIAKERIVIDPGFGFGKNYQHNLALFQHLDQLCKLSWPVLVGMSRKSMLGEMTGHPIDQRDVATAASSLLAAQQGVSIIRVHNVAATKDALSVLAAYNNQRKEHND
jgi:dihydropteroate synthase